MIVTTITYLNMTTISVIAKDIQSSLVKERKKLDDARTSAAATTQASPSTEGSRPRVKDMISWPTTTRVADRIKKMWNEDIEKSVRRLQETDWEKVGGAVQDHMKRARQRMVTSFERMGEDSKKST
jgi:hypothetical protein